MLPGRDELGQTFAELFELPEDIMLQLPVIFLAGNRHLYVENHKGIIEYRSDLLRLRITGGQLILNGTRFLIEELKERDILIKGDLTALEFEYIEEG